MTTPYGAWPSPISAALLVEASVGLGDVAVADGAVVWAERRPNEAGRQVPVRQAPGGEPRDLIPAPYSARSSVHEYGGRPFVVAGDTCWFVHFADQRIWASTDGGEPTPVTPPSDPARSVRYGDLAVDATRTALFAVRERHGVEGVEGVVNDLVWFATDGSSHGIVASGHDFYAAPRLAPDGRHLAFLAWDQPNMPWDESTLYVADLTDPGSATPVAGGAGESISQPRYRPDGTLCFLSDRSGFTSLHSADGTTVVDVGADLGGPDWVFGLSSYDFLPDGSVVAAVEGPRGAALTHFGPEWARPLAPGFDDASDVHVLGEQIAALVGSASSPSTLVLVDPALGTIEPVRASRSVPVDPGYLSTPEAIEVPTSRGPVYALYYPPTNPDMETPTDEHPPLVVVSHGGPTSRTSAAFDLRLQYFTSRGCAVVDVNYGGSSGFGRAYRARLDGGWGVVDVDDCVSVARHLADEGRVDPDRLAIRGGSAGGYTTLCALAFSSTFSVGASHYGISDLTGLASDTHKFEARYIDRLIGRLPEAQSTYDDRSPLVHAHAISCPVIFFQGLDDFVVPPQQAEVLVTALRTNGVAVAYLPFAGEGHGFRKAETIIEVAESEYAFFGAVLGFTPADPPRELPIENRAALGR